MATIPEIEIAARQRAGKKFPKIHPCPKCRKSNTVLLPYYCGQCNRMEWMIRCQCCEHSVSSVTGDSDTMGSAVRQWVTPCDEATLGSGWEALATGLRFLLFYPFVPFISVYLGWRAGWRSIYAFWIVAHREALIKVLKWMKRDGFGLSGKLSPLQYTIQRNRFLWLQDMLLIGSFSAIQIWRASDLLWLIPVVFYLTTVMALRGGIEYFLRLERDTDPEKTGQATKEPTT